MISHRRSSIATLLPLLVGACGGAGDGAGAPIVRDSAGIEIVENTAPALSTPAWTISAEPEVAIGVLDGEPNYQLYQVGTVMRLADGRIVVANGGTHQVRFYGPDGRFIRSIGNKGAGPGEFEALNRVGRYGSDSLMVYDWRHRRISVFDTAGTFARSFMVQLSAGEYPASVSPLPDGRLLVSTGSSFTPQSQSGLHRDSITYYVLSSTGTVLDTLGRFPGWESWVQTGDRSVSVTSRAFGRGGYVVPVEDFFYAADNDRWEIRLHRLDDQSVVRIIRLAHTPVAVTPDDIERYRQERAIQERMLADMPYPETYPVFASFMVDHLNHLWVAHYRRPGEVERRWYVFDSDGRLLFEIETPAGLVVTEIGRDYLVGTHRDDLDVEHVLLYGLDRRPAG